MSILSSLSCAALYSSENQLLPAYVAGEYLPKGMVLCGAVALVDYVMMIILMTMRRILTPMPVI